MKWSYTEILIMLALLLIVILIIWTTVYMFAPPVPLSRIYETQDGPEMQKAIKMIYDQLEKERKGK